MHAQQMIATHPHVKGSTDEILIRCIEECYACAQSCTACADACLGEDSVKDLQQCIRLNLDCADICAASGAIATRRTGSNEQIMRDMLQTCAAACEVCAGECERHASRHDYCRICADACRACEQACEDAVKSVH
ncbi:MAG TPA: four-helix bundle copper-binding protein [Hyphomicrobiaceae bacterium]|nr:four-helix bundle copper-binding protein [Hyphomicrobiaceae bacterium]